MPFSEFSIDDFDDFGESSNPNAVNHNATTIQNFKSPDIIRYLTQLKTITRQWGATCAILSGYIVASAAMLKTWGGLGDKVAAFFGISVPLARCLSFLPLALFTILHAVPRAYSWWKQRKVINVDGLVSRTYFRTEPYSEDDVGVFQRNDGMHDELLGWILKSDQPVLCLTGSSGVGKSSIVRAGVLPRLRQAGVRSIVLSRIDEPRSSLRKSILNESGLRSKLSRRKLGLRHLLEKFAKIEPSFRLLLVIDQFEEVLLTPSINPKRRRFIQALYQSLMSRPIAGVTILLVVRSDYSPFLGEFSPTRPLPELYEGRNWYDVKPFLLAEAHAFLARSGLKIPQSLEQAIFRQLATVEENADFVRPITLNMVGIVLVKRAIPGVERLIRKNSGGGFIRAYISQCLRESDVAGGVHDIVAEMISEKRTKLVKSIPELTQAVGCSVGVVKQTLLRLRVRSIVRSLDAQQQYWEISHDFVARLIDEAIRTWRKTSLQVVRQTVLPLSLVAVIGLLVAGSKGYDPLFDSSKVHLADQFGETELHAAVRLSYPWAVEWQIRHHADVNAMTVEHGRTPLMYAAAQGDQEIAAMLLRAGASPTIANNEGETALFLAAYYDRSTVVQTLCENAAAVNTARLTDLSTPLHLACKKNNLEIVRILLSHHADPNMHDILGETPLHYAANNGNVVILNALLSAGAARGEVDRNGKTAQMLAAVNGYSTVVNILGAIVSPVVESHGAFPHVRSKSQQ